MPVNVDVINLDVEITGKGHLSYCGHFVNIRYSDDEDLYLFCSACGHKKEFNGVPRERRWTAICYLLGAFEQVECEGEGKELEERIRNVVDRYVGKPADQGRVAALENDVQNVVGEGVPVEIDVP